MRSRDILNTYNRKYYKSKKGKEVSRKNSQRRRAKRNNAPVVENFTHQDIFIRDSYTCCLCGLPINPLLKYPDKLSASLEHCTPLSKNGEHSFENCRSSHLLCNLRKGASITEGSFEGAGI